MVFFLRVFFIVIVAGSWSLCSCGNSTPAYTGEEQDTALVVNTDTLTTASYNADSLIRIPPSKPK